MTISCCCLQLMSWVINVQGWELDQSQVEIQTRAPASPTDPELRGCLFKQKHAFGRPYSSLYAIMFQHRTLFICWQ